MPSCTKFFNDLSSCLAQSDCTQIHYKKPSECIQSLLMLKVYNQHMADGTPLDRLTVPPQWTPKECKDRHQSYLECRYAMANPRGRFRPNYGSGSVAVEVEKPSSK